MRSVIAGLFIFLLTVSPLTGQELNCRVSVNAEQVQTSDRQIFEDMETALEQFLNNTQWTSDVFEPSERIGCNIIITLQNTPTLGYFSGTTQIQSARPVFNSNYESILLNFADRDWQFEYIESMPLNFNENIFTSNLTSLLGFYANIILGMDYDSFGELAGNPFFQKALNIANTAQTSNRPGWDALGSTRNRYWLIENMTNQQMQSLRTGFYRYHRLGLDTYMQSGDDARSTILTVLKDLQQIKQQYPNSIFVISFLDAKRVELINIYSEGELNTRRQAFEILANLDPANRAQYEQMLK
ncbi:DUF4835 family protein [Fulvivirga sedimenti]|uniref:DUF4835 family protein n=1 Tax=Fulvivirga sedimenti TaxID=2879465 RepID=A0A9X1HM53_9BACT|nr:DUF4835 family protein [Fulvivirga sedimenti]MCA6073916.1 DUF4835 family protein [Fulvivirga sedimenti]